LLEKGYAIAFDSHYLIIRDIPYLDSKQALQIGTIVSKLVFTDQETVVQEDHQVFFAGSAPHHLDGKSMQNLGGGPVSIQLSEISKDVEVQRSFSNKPKGKDKFQDFFEKIEHYVTIISGPAIELHKANPYTFRAVKEIIPDSIFKIHDTLTSRAEIGDLSSKFRNEVVAVIGLGGTGAYILDFLIKTPVREIRAFDLDLFYVHNAFRSPGKVSMDELKLSKAEVYRSRYENFRTGLSFEPKLVDSSSQKDIEGVTFAFVCVDKGSSRKEILDLLISNGIPFIDVGMGVKRKDDALKGALRTTYYSTEHGQNVRNQQLSPEIDEQNDLYRTNIQISELNALNACLAVIKFKQIKGFYKEENSFYHLLFEVSELKLYGESE